MGRPPLSQNGPGAPCLLLVRHCQYLTRRRYRDAVEPHQLAPPLPPESFLLVRSLQRSASPPKWDRYAAYSRLRPLKAGRQGCCCCTCAETLKSRLHAANIDKMAGALRETLPRPISYCVSSACSEQGFACGDGPMRVRSSKAQRHKLSFTRRGSVRRDRKLAASAVQSPVDQL